MSKNDVTIRYGFDGKELEQGYNTLLRAMDRVNQRNRALNETSRKVTKEWVSGFKGAAVAITGYGFSLAKVIQASSNLEEATSKFNVVFKGVSHDMESWVKDLRNNFAMSETSARKFLASTQDLLKPMGVQINKAADLSRGMVKLAADLGSFNNLKTSDVLRDIHAALAGSYETTKKYGVVINEQVVKQKALAMELWNGTGAVSAAAKAQVTYRLMVEGSKDALGDMARTSDSFANVQKKMNAQFQDLAATVGKEVMPIVGDFMTVVTDIIQEFSELSPELKEIITTIGLLGTAILVTTKAVMAFGVSFKTALGPVSLAITGIGLLISAFKKGESPVKELSKAVEESKKSFQSIVRETKKYNKSLNILNKLKGLKRGTKEYTSALQKLKQLNPSVATANIRLAKSFAGLKNATKQAKEEIRALYKTKTYEARDKQRGAFVKAIKDLNEKIYGSSDREQSQKIVVFAKIKKIAQEYISSSMMLGETFDTAYEKIMDILSREYVGNIKIDASLHLDDRSRKEMELLNKAVKKRFEFSDTPPSTDQIKHQQRMTSSLLQLYKAIESGKKTFESVAIAQKKHSQSMLNPEVKKRQQEQAAAIKTRIKALQELAALMEGEYLAALKKLRTEEEVLHQTQKQFASLKPAMMRTFSKQRIEIQKMFSSKQLSVIQAGLGKVQAAEMVAFARRLLHAKKANRKRLEFEKKTHDLIRAMIKKASEKITSDYKKLMSSLRTTDEVRIAQEKQLHQIRLQLVKNLGKDILKISKKISNDQLAILKKGLGDEQTELVMANAQKLILAQKYQEAKKLLEKAGKKAKENLSGGGAPDAGGGDSAMIDYHKEMAAFGNKESQKYLIEQQWAEIRNEAKDVKDAELLEKQRQNVMDRLAVISKGLGQEAAAQTAALAKKLAREGKYHEISIIMKKNAEKAKNKIEEDYRKKALHGFTDFQKNLQTAAAIGGKQFFEASKGLSIALASIKGFEAAVSAFAKGMSIGGPVLAATFAAASTLATAAQIKQIVDLKVPAMLRGGIISPSAEGTLIRAGEMYKPEAIIPLRGRGLEELKSALGIGESGEAQKTEIHVHINGSVMADEIPEQVARAIDSALLRMKRNGESKALD